MELENELCFCRVELYNYIFGSKIYFDSFRGLVIDDVIKLRIGVFGLIGLGKSCFINMCECVVRKEEKGIVFDNMVGSEGIIIF